VASDFRGIKKRDDFNHRTHMTILRHTLRAAIIAAVVVWGITTWRPVVYAHPRVLLRAAHGNIELVTGQTARSFCIHVADDRRFMIGEQSFRWTDFPYALQDMTTIPFWLILAILLLPWWLMGTRLRQRKRWAKEGRCLSCGYNLQGSESGTCSECGAEYEISK